MPTISKRRSPALLCAFLVLGCGSGSSSFDAAHDRPSSKDGPDAAVEPSDAADAVHDLAPDTDSAAPVDGASSVTDAVGRDEAAVDSGDAGDDAGNQDALADGRPASDAADGGTDAPPAGPITGGPCSSGAVGATALRVTWLGSGGTAYVSYEVKGFPSSSNLKVGVYGYSTGFTPAFVDGYLADGGLELSSSDFVDITFSTAGLASIRHATFSIFGRSYSTTGAGSFSWQTFVGLGSTPGNSISNATPYQWYPGDVTAAMEVGQSSCLMRIKAGSSSNALVVSRMELCIDAL